MEIHGGFLLDFSPSTKSTWKDNSKLGTVALLVNLTSLAHVEAGLYIQTTGVVLCAENSLS